MRRETQQPRPARWKSSSYRVVDKWRDYICEYFAEHHSFVPLYDAFANFKNRRFRRHFQDAWSWKWNKPLWRNPPFHLIQQVLNKIKRDQAQCILIVPCWETKSWWAQLDAITVDCIQLPKGMKLYARDDTGPLRQREWSTCAFLVDGRLSDPEYDASSCGSQNEVNCGTDDESIFSDLCSSDDNHQMDSNAKPQEPSCPIRSKSESITRQEPRKNLFRRRVLTKNGVEKPAFPCFVDPFTEIDNDSTESTVNSQVHPTYVQEVVHPDLLRTLK